MALLRFNLGGPRRKPLTVLCLGAHCDDIEIGCGGTILKLARELKDPSFCWVVFSSNPEREPEALESAKRFLDGVKETHVEVLRLRDGFLPYAGAEVKEHFERLKLQCDPDLIFTHYRYDLHQDHRLVSDLTWNTFRNHLVLEYEVLKYDGDLGTPNVFVPLDERTMQLKIEHLLSCYGSQSNRRWFSEESFRSLACLRSVECAMPAKYVEAFYSRKLVLFDGDQVE